MIDTTTITYFLPAITAFFCFGATIASFNFIILNKGAKMNATWILSALGTTTLGVANLFDLLGFFLPWIPAMQAVSAAFLFAGAFYARALYKKLLK
jgi:hypothetical protein